MGISNRFEAAGAANLYAPQAFYALDQDGSELVRLFFGGALSYMIRSCDPALRFAARHPAADRLERLSRDRGIDYLSTMREYLMCDRSVKRTAERLFLHRNTVIYRIEQARQAAKFDLDDDYERHHLLYSLTLNQIPPVHLINAQLFRSRYPRPGETLFRACEIAKVVH